MSVRILPSGEAALLVECDSLDAVLALHDALAASPIDGLVELVPAARTLLVSVDPARLPLETASGWVRRTAARTDTRRDGPAREVDDVVTVPVVYDGADLASVSDVLGLTVDDVVARHVTATWRVAFIGFAPGFAYLVSDEWTFDVPRLASPRTRVPAGAVGLAGTFSGAYPRESPGGWQLIGRTGAALWDPAAASPALLTPGTTVRFERNTR